MKTVVKFLMISLGLILLGIGVVGILFFTRTHTSKRALEGALTRAFGAETKISSVVFAPMERSIYLYGMRIENPPNFLPGTAVEAGRTQIAFDLRSLLSDAPRIPLVRVEDAVFNMRHEMGEGANLSALVQGPSSQTNPESGSETARRYTVERVEMTGGRLAMSSNVAPDSTIEMDVAPIAVDKPAGDSPLAPGEAGKAILRDVLAKSISAEGLMKPAAERLQEEWQRFRDSLPDFLQPGVEGENTAPVP